MYRRTFQRAVVGSVVAAGLVIALAHTARADDWGDRWHDGGGDWREHGWDGGWGYPPPVTYVPAPPYGAPYAYGPPPVVPYGVIPYGYYRHDDDD